MPPRPRSAMPSLSGSCWRTSPGWMMPSLTPPTGSSRGSVPRSSAAGRWSRGCKSPRVSSGATLPGSRPTPTIAISCACETAARKGLLSTRLAGCCTRPSQNRGIWLAPALSAPWSGRSCSRITVCGILPSFWKSTACRCGWANTRKGRPKKRRPPCCRRYSPSAITPGALSRAGWRLSSRTLPVVRLIPSW